MTAPTTQLEDARKLTGDAYVELFELTFTTGSKMHITNGQAVTWRSNTYEFHPIKMESFEQSATDEDSRPKCTISNPAQVFNPLVAQGKLDNAQLTRYRVLKTDMLANNTNYTAQTWRIRRVTMLGRDVIQVELRNQFDGQFFQIPGRVFAPPEFGQVKLS